MWDTGKWSVREVGNDSILELVKKISTLIAQQAVPQSKSLHCFRSADRLSELTGL